MIEAQKVKEDRRRSHTRAGKEKPKAERKSESFLVYICDTWLTMCRDCYQGAEVVGLWSWRQVVSLVLVSFSRF
jgi:hypothetical protein